LQEKATQGTLARSIPCIVTERNGEEAVPESEVFEPVTVRQYIAGFHRTLSEHSLQSSGSKHLPCHRLLSSTQAGFDQSQFHVLQCMA
jgi:hypothetical protein